jgi:hypothetical protein
MARSIIYTVDAANRLTAMSPAAPENEDTMQRLIADYPEIIADADEALLLIRREQPIADSEGARWSLDHLFVTRGGVPVLVEMKRASDTRLRREVVGQMLDYAANATAHWQAGTIAASFAATAETQGRDPDQLLAEFLGDGAEPEEFWPQVDANFAAGRIKLVFVADVIPRELARIVEFLNEQMKADVRAVELSWFEGQGIRAFTPRIIGETERAQAAKGRSAGDFPARLSHEEWIETYLARYGEATMAAARVFMDSVAAAGGQAIVTRAQGSIVAEFGVGTGMIYPMSLTRYGRGQLSLAYLKSSPGYSDDQSRRALYGRLRTIVGPLSTETLTGYPSFPATVLVEPGVGERLTIFLRDAAEGAQGA